MICRVTAGDDYFYTRIAGQPLVSNIRASVTADGLVAAGWPWYSAPGSPAGSTSLDIEADLRAWVEEAYPELEDQLDGVDGQSFDGIKTTGETGEFRMQLLDEFLASRS